MWFEHLEVIRICGAYSGRVAKRFQDEVQKTPPSKGKDYTAMEREAIDCDSKLGREQTEVKEKSFRQTVHVGAAIARGEEPSLGRRPLSVSRPSNNPTAPRASSTPRYPKNH